MVSPATERKSPSGQSWFLDVFSHIRESFLAPDHTFASGLFA